MEFSQLNGYKVKDKKATRYYDNVESMKNDTTLKEGMHVKTKGYYNSNDGGGSEYYITSTISETEHQEELENNLYASLINNNIIDIKQLGAKENDQTFDNSIIINQALSIYKEISINGEYYISNSIEMNHDNVIYSFRNTRINDIGNNEYSIKINANAISTFRTAINKNFIVSYDKFFLYNRNFEIDKIGILIDSDTTSYPYEGIINGIILYHYDIGIKCNLQNFYLNEFNNVHFEKCRIGLLLGEENNTSQTISNSGENIRLKDCLFTKCNLAIYSNIKNALYITNSSFDFNGLGFYNDMRVVVCCSNCHFETFGRDGDSTISYNDLKGLLKDNYYATNTPNSIYQFNNCEIVHYNKTDFDNYNGYYIIGQGNYILNDCIIQARKEVFTELTPLANNKVIKNNNVNYVDELRTRLIDSDSLIDKNFVLDNSDLKYYEANISSSNYSVEDNEITITSNVQTETAISFISKNKIYNLKNFVISDVLFKPTLDWYNSSISNYLEYCIRYYDNTDTVIGTQWNISSTEYTQNRYNQIYGSEYDGYVSCGFPSIKKLEIPANTQYARVFFRLVLKPTSLTSRTVKIKSPIIQFT